MYSDDVKIADVLTANFVSPSSERQTIHNLQLAGRREGIHENCSKDPKQGRKPAVAMDVLSQNRPVVASQQQRSFGSSEVEAAAHVRGAGAAEAVGVAINTAADVLCSTIDADSTSHGAVLQG